MVSTVLAVTPIVGIIVKVSKLGKYPGRQKVVFDKPYKTFYRALCKRMTGLTQKILNF